MTKTKITVLATATIAGATALASNAFAADINVYPGNSIVTAINHAAPGDRVLVHAGSYTGGGWIGPVSGTASAPIQVLSVDGPRAAKITGGTEALRIGDASSYLVFDGFEVSGAGNNVMHIDGQSHDITLRNMYLHDAGYDGDVLKVNQVQRITVENSEMARPGQRADTSGGNPYQECLDFVDVDDSAIRGNFIHDGGSMLMFVKGGSKNDVIERNVYSEQRAGASDPAVGLGGPTDPWLLGGEQYEIINVVFRNNVIMNGKMGAIAVYDANGAYIANNLLLNNDRVLIEFRAGNGPAGGSTTVRAVNNLMVDTRGTMPTPYNRLSHTLSDFTTSNNLFWNNGSAIPTSPLLTVTAQPGHLNANPGITVPATNASRATVISSAKPSATSQAAGTAMNVSSSPYSVTTDITGAARGTRLDRGPWVLASTSTSTGTGTSTSTGTTSGSTSTSTSTGTTSGSTSTSTSTGTTSGSTTTTTSGSTTYSTCPPEPTTLDANGEPRNSAGRIRYCWPGEAYCHCDVDNDCYAQTGYVPCSSTSTSTSTSTTTTTASKVTSLTATNSPTTGVANSATTIRATQSGSTNPRYTYWVMPPGGSWTKPCGTDSTSASCSFTPTLAGTWSIQVSAKDASSTASYDYATPVTSYTVAASTTSTSTTTTTTGTKVTSVTMTAPSTSILSRAVTLSATSSGSAAPRYTFRVQSPYGTWSQPCGSNTTATSCSFTPDIVGIYHVQVTAKDANSTATYDAATTIKGIFDTANGTFCPPDTTKLDANGEPRNNAGHIRYCWPGEANCACDVDSDCYARTGYVACSTTYADNAVRTDAAAATGGTQTATGDATTDVPGMNANGTEQTPSTGTTATSDVAGASNTAASDTQGGMGCSVSGRRGSNGMLGAMGLLGLAAAVARIRRRRAN